MFEWDLKKRVIAGALGVGILFSTGFYFGVVYQSVDKTDKIYKSGLEDFNEGDY